MFTEARLISLRSSMRNMNMNIMEIFEGDI